MKNTPAGTTTPTAYCRNGVESNVSSLFAFQRIACHGIWFPPDTLAMECSVPSERGEVNSSESDPFTADDGADVGVGVGA